jgi:hypothetical protein
VQQVTLELTEVLEDNLLVAVAVVVQLALQDQREHQETQAQLVLQDQQELQVQLDQAEQLVLLDHKVTL